jgi:hypothetical protein
VKPSKPNFQSIVDLGLRDVGVKNDPRRLAMRLGKAALALIALVLVSAILLCAILIRTGADRLVVSAFLLVWVGAAIVVAFQTLKRSAPVVVKVNAEGTNHATWLVVAPFVLVVIQTALFWDPMLIPLLALGAIMVVLAWRGRGRVPEVLRALREVLAEDEVVVGDGIGLARGGRGRREAFRLVAATDRRLLVAGVNPAAERFLLVDAPYRDVSRFGIEWRYRGRVGVLSLTVAGPLGEPPETHVIGSVAPLNLLSIARALTAQGVQADDPAAVPEAEAAWEEARREDGPRARLFDRAAMSTRDFDRGMWLLLVLAGVTLYPAKLGAVAGFGVIAALCVACGYASATRSSLAYIVPLNLLVSPLFFFTAASDVIALMLVLSVVAAVCLWAGSALRRTPASPGSAAARGSLRFAVSGLSLVRISGVLLAAMLALVVTAAAAGFELTQLKLAVDEATVTQLPVDGRSNLTGNAASLTYTPGPGLHEFVADEDWDGGPNDGARWELRSSFSEGENTISLAHYIFEPRLDDPAAIADFLADKDDEHSRIAGTHVRHSRRIVDGRTGYVWTHGNRHGYWHYALWFPRPVHSIRVECVARDQIRRFKRLCDEATSSLRFH